MSYEKGINSREQLINQSREIFNEEGLNVTLNTIAASLGITLGKLTYHFSTKDRLFVAIAEEYELRLAKLRSNEKRIDGSLINFYHNAGEVMDLQYEFRCAMRYFAASSRKQIEIANHSSQSFKTRKESIYMLTKLLVNNGELKKVILTDEPFKVFLFVFSCLFTSWPVNLEIYDSHEEYSNMKTIYLKGIFSSFIPYLTLKGKESLRSLAIIE